MPEHRPTEDPGAYIGREPERATETIPGGIEQADERVAAGATRSTGVGGADRRDGGSAAPSGHREGPAATDDEVRRAGSDG